MEPIDGFPPITPFTLHVTLVLVLPVIVAVYWDVVPSVTFAGPFNARVTGVLTVGGGGVASATGRLCETVGLATLVAVMVIVAGSGALVGAV